MSFGKEREARLAAALAEHYEFVAPLGAGGFASVYRVRNLRLRRLEALKVLAQELSEDSDFAERFEQEARVSASLDHPNIVKIYDYGVTDGIAWFTMQLIEGKSLAKELRESEAALSEGDVARIIVPLLDALEYSHGRGVIHRDIKPDNIMLDVRKRPYLMDFGIAKAEDSAVKTRAGLLMGSPAYMAPEQIMGQTVDGRTDLYALGVTMYKMLTGGFPFTAADTLGAAMKKLQEEPERLSNRRRDIDPDFEAIVMKGLARDPGGRFGNAAEMRAAFEEYFNPLRIRGQSGAHTPGRLGLPWERTPSSHASGAAVAAPADSEPLAPTTVRPRSQDGARRDSGGKPSRPWARTLIQAEARPRSRWFARVGVVSVLAAFAAIVWFFLRVGGDTSASRDSRAPRQSPKATPPAASLPSLEPSRAAPSEETLVPTKPAPQEVLPTKREALEIPVAPTVRESRRETLIPPAKRARVDISKMSEPIATPVATPSAGFRYCASISRTAYLQGAISELPAGFAPNQGQVYRGPRTDAARIQIEFTLRPVEPREAEPFEVTAMLANGGDEDLTVARVDESTPRGADAFQPVAGLHVPTTVSSGGVFPIFRSTAALRGGGTYRKELKVTDSFKDAWQSSIVLTPCRDQ